jgi:hypothetical protein
MSQITPFRIALFYQVQLPLPFVFLQPRFAIDGRVYVFENLIIDQGVNAILLGEPPHHSFFVFPNTPREAVGDADIERAVARAGEDIDVIASAR